MIRAYINATTKAVTRAVIPSDINTSIQFNNGKVLFVFDDAAISMYTDGLPAFVSKGATATLYTNGFLADGTNPDYCRWSELLEMYNAGLDIQCHTYNHYRLTEKTEEEIHADLLQQNAAFVENGLPSPQHLAYPEGLYNAAVKAAVSAYRKTARCSATYYNYINRGSDKLALTSYWLDATTAEMVANAKTYMDEAKLNKGAIIFSGHGVTAAGSSSSITTASLLEIIDYANTIGMDVINISQLYRLMMSNYIHPRTELSLTATETGAGVANIIIVTSEDTIVRVGGGAKMYTDAAGTLNETEELQLYAGQTTMYIRQATGAGYISIEHDRITQIREWASAVNAPSLGGDISLFVNLNYLSVAGQNTISGDITNKIKLTDLLVLGSNTLSGNVEGLVNLTYLRVSGSNTITGSIEGLTSLINLNTSGNNTLSGSISGLTLLQSCTIDGVLTTVTAPSVINIKGLSVLRIFQTTLTSSNVNQILADFWANKDEVKIRAERQIIINNAYSGAPSGQGLIDKANLQAYRTPNNEEEYALWTVTTR